MKQVARGSASGGVRFIIRGFFSAHAHYLATGELLPDRRSMNVRVMSRHLDLMVEVFGETHGCRMFRKVAPWYSKRFGPANEFNKRIAAFEQGGVLRDSSELCEVAGAIPDENGELKPQYRPAPLVASFMQEPGVAGRSAIPVPKGRWKCGW